MQKIHTYTLLLITTLTFHLTPMQATEATQQKSIETKEESLDSTSILYRIQKNPDFIAWQDNLRNKTTEIQEALEKITVDGQPIITIDDQSIIKDIVSLITDYLFFKEPYYDRESIKETIQDKKKLNDREFYAMLIPAFALQAYGFNQSTTFKDCFIVLDDFAKKDKLPFDGRYDFEQCTFIKTHFTSFGFDEELVSNLGPSLIFKGSKDSEYEKDSTLLNCSFKQLDLIGFSTYETQIINCLIEDSSIIQLRIADSIVTKTVFNKLNNELPQDDSDFAIHKSKIEQSTISNSKFTQTGFYMSILANISFKKHTSESLSISSGSQLFKVLFQDGSFNLLCDSNKHSMLDLFIPSQLRQCTFQRQTIEKTDFINNLYIIDSTLDHHLTENDKLKGATLDEKTIRKSASSIQNHLQAINTMTTAGVLTLTTYTCCQTI